MERVTRVELASSAWEADVLPVYYTRLERYYFSMTNLSAKKCAACEGGVPPLTRDAALNYLKQISGWTLQETVPFQIERDFKFKNFKEAMAFVNKVAELAESEGHHPNILIHSWNKVRLTLYTHAIGGLSENDFIMAAKVNQL